MSDSVRPHRWQPTRLPRPWNSPGRSTGVGCHCLLHFLIPSVHKFLFSQFTLLDLELCVTLMPFFPLPPKLTWLSTVCWMKVRLLDILFKVLYTLFCTYPTDLFFLLLPSSCKPLDPHFRSSLLGKTSIDYIHCWRIIDSVICLRSYNNWVWNSYYFVLRNIYASLKHVSHPRSC